MTGKLDIIEDHLLNKKLISVWEMIRDDSSADVEGYALSFEGYFLEIKTMLDVSAIGIECWHVQEEFPQGARSGCFYHEVSHNNPYAQCLDKEFSKWRLIVGEREHWEGLMISLGRLTGLCFMSVECSISMFLLNGTQY